MGLKLNVGISKKIGLPDYGSAGSLCHLELELDSSALEQPEEFHRRVQEVFAACRSAVEEELTNHRSKASQDTRPTPPPKTEYGGTTSSKRNESRYAASPKQMEYIGRLSKDVKGLSAQKLEEYCRAKFGRDVTQLSSQDASKLIDDLKQAKSGGKEFA